MSPANANFPRGTVGGSGDKKAFTEQPRRRRRILAPTANATLRWKGAILFAGGLLLSRQVGRRSSELYWKTGRTRAGHQRYACKLCRSTFTDGRLARNHRRQSKNGQILKLLVHGNSLSKVSEIVDLSPRDVYRKLDFIHERVREFTARREGDLRDTDWHRFGRRFATDSQTLTLNWPNRKKRASVAVHHLCTAHANSGYIVLGHLQFDPLGDMEQIEIDMSVNGDLTKDRCWRRHGRLWTGSEFKEYLDDITAGVVLDPETAPDVDLGLQLPHEGGLVRQDIQQYAHALMLRRMALKSDSRFYFGQDGGAGLSKAFLAAFAPQVREGRVDVATVAFAKYEVNGAREALWTQGRRELRKDLGLTPHQLGCLPERVLNEEIDREIVKRLAGHPLGTLGRIMRNPSHRGSST